MRKYPIFDAGILVCIAFFFLKKRETPAALPRGSCQTGGNVGCGDISVEGHIVDAGPAVHLRGLPVAPSEIQNPLQSMKRVHA